MVALCPGGTQRFLTTIPSISRRSHKKREWSREQRARRRRKLTNGEELFDDVGLTFYLVRKGDTISEIRERLGSHPEFHYLKTSNRKVGFV